VMGILEDLKREANNSCAERERALLRRKELENIYLESIRPSMFRIHNYLRELVEQLGLVSWHVTMGFDFPGIGRVDHLSQKNYRNTIDSRNEPKLINLSFECVAHEENVYSVMPKSSGDEACQFLATQKVLFTDWAIRDVHQEVVGTFIKCKLRVRVGITFNADIGNQGIRVILYNFEGQGEKSFLSHYYSIDDQWLDKLGRYILRKDDSFRMLEITEEQRMQIRKLLEEAKKRTDSLCTDNQHCKNAHEGLLLKVRKLFHNP